MKKIFAFLLFCTSFFLYSYAQQASPQLLKGPAGWEFERFDLPPAFAPGIPYKGAEELRFSPGMFKKDSANYFTYAFAAQLDNTLTITQDNIKNYLLSYFKGLCSGTANNRQLTIDTSKISLGIERKKNVPLNGIMYNASLNIFGVFTDGAPVKLNMEIKVVTDTSAKKTYLIFIASPQPKTNKIWEELYKIQKDFNAPV